MRKIVLAASKLSSLNYDPAAFPKDLPKVFTAITKLGAVAEIEDVLEEDDPISITFKKPVNVPGLGKTSSVNLTIDGEVNTFDGGYKRTTFKAFLAAQ